MTDESPTSSGRLPPPPPVPRLASVPPLPRWASTALAVVAAAGGLGGFTSLLQEAATRRVTERLDTMASQMQHIAESVKETDTRIRSIERYVDREEAVRRMRESSRVLGGAP